MSPRLELFKAEAPVPAREDRTNNPPLLLLGILGSWASFKTRVGLDEDAYRMGDESKTVSE